MGYFNEITIQNEKVCWRPRPRAQMTDFKSALETNGLIDLG